MATAPKDLYNQYTQQAQNLFGQFSQMNKLPDFKQELVKQYETPVLKPLVNERADLESQYLPALFQPFAQMGTGAADMSPAAKLAAVGGSLGRLTGRIGANQNIQGFYGNQIDNLANTLRGNYMDQRDSLWKQYMGMNDAAGRAFDQDIAQQDLAMRQRQLNAQLASQRKQQEYDQMIRDYMNRGGAGGGGASPVASPTVDPSKVRISESYGPLGDLGAGIGSFVNQVNPFFGAGMAALTGADVGNYLRNDFAGGLLGRLGMR